jgi:hypothetical protein
MPAWLGWVGVASVVVGALWLARVTRQSTLGMPADEQEDERLLAA